MIKLIICDFTGVIVTGGHKKLSKILAKRHGLDADKVYSILYTKYFNKYALNQISEQEASQRTIDELNLIGETWQGLVEQYLKTHVVNQLMVDYLAELRKDYKMVLLTKNIKHYLDWEREKFGLDNMFDDIINTSEINLPKSSQETLNYVLDRYQVKPEEILYVDDQEANLDEAGKMGMSVVLYKNFEQVKSEFEKILNN